MIDDPLCNGFGEAVRARRRTLSLSQEELASRARLHRNYIGGVERGERNPGLRNAAALARSLGVQLSVLIAEAELLADEKHPDPA
ncbi:MAG: helix-turn-helix domain-containing protein [Solirubrobacteraceae bacterium]